ncbi:hypothetical protein HG531_005501 [Fusarium graminearum]|nr:hypothetical protein HG531_005501 [Fusarium graminearum]
MISAATAPFLAHALIETPAALTFILKPSTQLQPLPPSAALIVQSFGGCILTTNLIALIFLRRPFDHVAQHVALAFAFWHIWPCYRAYMRMNVSEQSESRLFNIDIHIVVALVLVELHLASEQRAEESVNSTLLPRTSVLGSHKVLHLLVDREAHLAALACLAVDVLTVLNILGCGEDHCWHGVAGTGS